MCITLLAPVVCTYQMLVRVFLSILYATEDVIRLLIHIVHSYVSTVLHAISFIPACIVYCCVKQYYCCWTSSFKPDDGYTSSCVCFCFLITSLALAIFIVLYYTYWIEDFLQEMGLELPKNIFGKEDRYGSRLRPRVDYVFNNKTYDMQEEEKFHKYAGVAAMIQNVKTHSGSEVENKQEHLTTNQVEVITNSIETQVNDNSTVKTTLEEDFTTINEIFTTPVTFVATLHVFSDFVTDSTNQSTDSGENVSELRHL